ncbi:prostacyclin synthase [Gastrophryne carolinensis]
MDSSGSTMIAALLLGISFSLLVWAAFLRRRRRPDEPPLDCGFIPWLGHALDFRKDSATFLTQMKAKHGDIFTVQVAGKFVTVLLDPHSYDRIVWESRENLDFGKYAEALMERIFDVTLPHDDVTEEKSMLQIHLQQRSLASLASTMFTNLCSILRDSGTTAWKEDGLFSFTYGVMLRAGYLTLFGSQQNLGSSSWEGDLGHSLKVYNAFRKFDQLLMKSARGLLTKAEKKQANQVKENLWHLLDAEKLKRRVNRSSWLECYQRQLEEQKVPRHMQTRAMLLQLWATQGNTGPATFWLLLFLLKHPRAMAAVRGELEATIQRQKLNRLAEISTLDSATIFNSVLEESLRLTAAPYITREVLREQLLKLADGSEYTLRRGDRLCLFPYVSPQMDPEIHQEPEVFRYDRFLNADGTEKRDFYKRGQRLQHFTMPWGAGVNACVGRFHAVHSIKLFVWLLMMNFEFELKNPEVRIPAFDKSRYGFGVVQPQNDIVFRYRRRPCAAQL